MRYFNRTRKTSWLLMIMLAGTLSTKSSLGLAQSAVEVANYRQAVAMYSSITGVSDQTPEIKEFVASAAARLPQTGSPDELSATSTLTFVSLAGLYCNSMINADAAQATTSLRRAHKGVNFTLTPAQLTAEVKAGVAAEYAQLFWQRTPGTNEAQELVGLMNAVSVGLLTAADTKTVFLAACTAAGASLATIAH